MPLLPQLQARTCVRLCNCNPRKRIKSFSHICCAAGFSSATRPVCIIFLDSSAGGLEEIFSAFNRTKRRFQTIQSSVSLRFNSGKKQPGKLNLSFSVRPFQTAKQAKLFPQFQPEGIEGDFVFSSFSLKFPILSPN